MLISIAEIPEGHLSEVFNLMVLEAKLRYPGDSQRKIAETIGIPPAVFSRCKAGSERKSNIRKHLRKFAIALNVGVDKLEDDEYRLTIRRVKAQGPIGGVVHDPTLYFIYHYVANSRRKEMKIGKALLEINLNRHTASLFFYESKNNLKEEYSSIREVKQPTPIVEYYGDVSSHEGTTYLLFNNRKETGGEAQEVPALVCLDTHREHLASKSIVIGSFATAGPAAGITVLQRSRGANHLEDVFSEVVVPEIGKILVRKRFARERYQEELFSYWSTEGFVQKVQSMEGRYNGFYLEERAPSGKPEGEEDFDTFQEIIKVAQFEIYDGHKIKFRTKSSGDIKGYITKVNADFLYARFDYDYEADHFSVAITLSRDFYRLRKGIRSSTLAGAYLSSRKRKVETDEIVSQSSVKWKTAITSGRILLSRTDDDKVLPNFNLCDDDAIVELKSRHPYLLDFFGGGLGDFYTDSPLVHKGEALKKEVVKQPIEVVDKRLRRFAGLYLTFRLATDHKRVYQRPVKIYAETGDVIRRVDYTSKQEHKTLFGKASIVRDEVLSLDFNIIVDVHPALIEQEIFPASRHTLIHTYKGKLDGGKAYQGVTVRLSGEQNPISFREYYVKISDASDYASLIKTWTRNSLPKDEYARKLVMALLNEGDRAVILQH